MADTKEYKDLSKYKEKVTVGKQTLSVSAYRMDKDDKHMGQEVGLGHVSACDYLYLQDKKVLFIEDTYLGKSIEDFFKELRANEIANGDEKNKERTILDKPEKKSPKEKEYFIRIFKKSLIKENCLKCYGSYIIFHLLKNKHKKLKEDFEETETETGFLFVINDDEKDIRAIDYMNIVEYLKKGLEGALQGTKLVKSIHILFSVRLKEKLREFQNTI